MNFNCHVLRVHPSLNVPDILWFSNPQASVKRGAPNASENGAPSETTTVVTPEEQLAVPATQPPKPAKVTKKKAKQKPVPKISPPKNSAPEGPSAPAPRTPPKRKTAGPGVDCMGLLPGQRSPHPIEKGQYCKGCDHDALKLVGYEKTYFTEEQLAKEYYPSECNTCQKHFIKDRDYYWPPNKKSSNRVMVCNNAVRFRNHKCVFALCHVCWPIKMKKDLEAAKDKTPEKRTKRVRQQYSPSG